jgi:hypothetical protein
MRNKNSATLISIIIVGICLIASAGFAKDYIVNTYTENHQWAPKMAIDGNGKVVVTWHSEVGEPGKIDIGVYAQRFDQNGAKIGSEFCANTYTTYGQQSPDVAMNSTGNFVITWFGSGDPALDPKGAGIYAQRFGSNGKKAGQEFIVNTYPAGSSFYYPNVAMAQNGSFVIVWNGVGDQYIYGVFAQRFDSNGNRLGGEFLVNTYTDSIHDEPAIAMNDSGNFVIAWEGKGDPALGGSDLNDIMVQRFDSSGNKAGNEILVNTYKTGVQTRPDVAIFSDGRFVVTWEGQGDPALGDTEMYGCYAQVFDANGSRIGNEFLVNTTTESGQSGPCVATSKTGGFLIVWYGYNGTEDRNGINGQWFDDSGSKVGNEFLISNPIYNTYGQADCKIDKNDRAIVTWTIFNLYSGTSKYDVSMVTFPKVKTSTVEIYPYYVSHTVGSSMDISVKVKNITDNALDMYAALYAGGKFFFYNKWDANPYPTSVDPQGTLKKNILLLTVTDAIPKGSYTFFAAIAEHGTTNIIGIDSTTIKVE